MARRVLLWVLDWQASRDGWERAGKVGAYLLLWCMPFLIAGSLWRLSNGWAACVCMLLIGGVSFLATTWYRWNVLEPRMTEAERATRKLARRTRRTAYWQRIQDSRREDDQR